jgi:hypothetical protein
VAEPRRLAASSQQAASQQTSGGWAPHAIISDWRRRHVQRWQIRVAGPPRPASLFSLVRRRPMRLHHTMAVCAMCLPARRS